MGSIAFATRCFEDGMDIKEVQRLLGHASPGITMEIYVHYCESQRQQETFDKVRRAKGYLRGDLPRLEEKKAGS